MKVSIVALLVLLGLVAGCSSSQRPPGPVVPVEPDAQENGLRVMTTQGAFVVELYREHSPWAYQVAVVATRFGAYTHRSFSDQKFGRYRAYSYITLEAVDEDKGAQYRDGVQAPTFRAGSVGMRRMPGKVVNGMFVNSTVTFFICTEMSPKVNLLNGQYTVLGVVREGMDVVKSLTAKDKVLSASLINIERLYDLPETVRLEVEKENAKRGE